MTIAANTPKTQYIGDGAQVAFAVGFEFFADTDLEVVTRPTGASQADTVHVLTTDFSVAGTPTGGTPFTNGTVTFVTAPANLAKVLIRLKPKQTQTDDLVDNAPLPAGTLEKRLDLLTQQVIELQEEVTRAPKFPLTDLGSTSILAQNEVDRANKYMAFDGSGNPTVGVALTAQVVAYSSDVFDGDNSTVAFTLSSAPASTDATDVYISGVRQTPTTDYTVAGAVLTFVGAPPVGTGNILVVYSQAFAGSVADGAVTAIKLAASAVETAKINAAAVTEAKLAADAVDWDTKIKAATAGDLPMFDASGDPVRLAKGTTLQELRMNAGATVPEWFTPAPPLSAKFTSTEQTITAGGSLSLAHGLTVANTYDVLVRAVLVCQTAQLGYSVGDALAVNPAGNDPGAAGSMGLSIVPDATNLVIRFGNTTGVFRIIHKGTGADAAITASNWRVRFIAYV